MKQKNSIQTVATLANASVLVGEIAQAVIGNDVADSIEGNLVTREATYALAQSRFQSKLNVYRGKANA